MRLAVLALALLVGCAGASVHDYDGLVYRAWAFGQGHAAAGRCDRVATDESRRWSACTRAEGIADWIHILIDLT